MAEYIEREALMQDLSETVVFTVRGDVKLPTSEMRGANKVIDRIKSAPIADVVEVKHGKWITPTNILDKDYDVPHCSVCERVPTEKGCYCSNCGAKMT